MTTITNFLHSNFLDNQQVQSIQLPVWVVSGSRNNKINTLKQYLIDNCINTNKILVHVDLGISTCRLARDAEQKINLEKNLDLYIPQKGKPYYLISLSSEFRKDTKNCLNILIKHLNSLPAIISNIKSEHKHKSSISLLVQGLELITSEKQSNKSLQSFINHLSTVDKAYKQITIFKYEKVLLPEHQFVLERISTCLTDIQSYEAATGIWTVKSTVRRYTGFSNEERYFIKSVKPNKLKVQKWTAPKEEEQTEAQKKMISELGFVVKKGDTAHKEEGIKQMIYPYLRMQNVACACNKKDCKNCSCQQPRPQDQGIIILDDEQQDDDDVDV